MTAMVKKQTVTFADWLRVGIQRAGVIHFVLLIAYGVQIIVMDAWHVIVPQIVLERWIAGGLLLIAVAIVWYLAHNRNNSVATFKRLLFALVVSDIAFGAFNVYVQRGMAARAVALFAIPIAVSAILLSRAAIIATAAVCTAAYSGAAVAYFVLNFNEGYKTELYSEVAFYCFSFFVLAALLAVVVRFGGSTNEA